MTVHAAKGLEFPVVVVADRTRSGHGGSTPRILHDPEFGVVCQLRDANGDWVKPASYLWAEWLNERMELAESRRLLYVACTRAADLLILSGKPGEPRSWLAALTAAWELPLGDGDDAVVEQHGYSIRLRYPELPAEGRTGTVGLVPAAAGMTELPPLARPLSSVAAPRPIAVTHLERGLDEEAGELPVLRPAVLAGRDSNRPKRAPRYLVGNLAHRALATGTAWERRPMCCGRSWQRGAAAPVLRCPMRWSMQWVTCWVRSIACGGRPSSAKSTASERHAETPFSLETPVGTSTA